MPLLDVPSAALLHSANGVEVSSGGNCGSYSAMVSSKVSTEMSSAELAFAEEMYAYLELERKWVEEHARRLANNATNALEDEDTLSDKWAQLDAEYLMNRNNNTSNANAEAALVRVPLGEKVKLKVTLTNKLPVELHLTDVRVLMEPAAAFETTGVALQLKDNTVQEVMLTTKPLQLGKYTIDTARWNLSESLSVKHSLTKPGKYCTYCCFDVCVFVSSPMSHSVDTFCIFYILIMLVFFLFFRCTFQVRYCSAPGSSVPLASAAPTPPCLSR